MVKCKTCKEEFNKDETFDGYCENCIPKPLCERCNDGSDRYCCERRHRMNSDRYKPLHKLTSEDRKEIYEFAMKRSDEILRGLDSPAGQHQQRIGIIKN